MSATVHRVERPHAATAIVTLRIDAGYQAGVQLADALGELANRGVRRLAVDLRDPAMLNSKVLQAVDATARRLALHRDAAVVVISDTQYIDAMLGPSVTDGTLSLVADRDAALALLSGQA